MKDESMDMCLDSLYKEMAIYFLNTGQSEKAYKVSYALLGSKFREDPYGVAYIVIDSACLKLLPEFRQKLPKEYTLDCAIKK